jgi:vacuolar-type H+-ATPase subunit I/STV1
MNEDKNMNEKYQQYYNQIISGTLTDTLLKSISLQANVKLANDIIADQEKVIVDLQTSENSSKKELQTKITSLEENGKNSQAIIAKLQSDLYEANKLRAQYENVKHQVQHMDTFRNDLVKAREDIKNLQTEHEKKVESLKAMYESEISKLNLAIETLKTPTSKKKAVKVTKTASVKKAPIKTIEVEEIQDGGSF